MEKWKKVVITGFTLSILSLTFYGLSQMTVINLVGSSMEPTSYSGDTSLCFEQDRYYPGDIVSIKPSAFEQVDTGIHHRVITVKGDKVQTKGDNNQYPDPVINMDDIRCQTMLIIPTSGKL